MSIHTGDKVYSFKCHVLCLLTQGIKFILYSNTIYSQGWVKLSRITHLGSKWNSVQKYVVLQWMWSLHNQKARRWEQRAEDESSRAEWQELRGMHESGGWGICKWRCEFRRMQILPLEPVESAAPQTKEPPLDSVKGGSVREGSVDKQRWQYLSHVPSSLFSGLLSCFSPPFPLT